MATFILVHGTFATAADWPALRLALAAGAAGEHSRFEQLIWSGKNRASARQVAASKISSVVRRDGWLSQNLQDAMRIQTDRVRWFDNSHVGFACFNSVRSGQLARGCIDETEMMDLGLALDREREKATTFVLAGLLHHHPIPVVRPEWYRQDWFERLLGRTFEQTDALINSEQFLSWLSARRIGLVLHGHKHIPRVEVHDGIMVVGCGSTVGKVHTNEPGTTYMSINVVTIDALRGRVSCRLRAERIPGGGLTAGVPHEAILTAPVFE